MRQQALSWEAVPAPPGLLYEGARWLDGPQKFQWVDILGHSVHRWSPLAGGGVETRELDLEFVTVAIPIDDRRQLVASRSSIHVYDWADGDLTTVATATLDEDVRFNDGGRSPSGDFFIGTMSMEGRPGAGALFRLDGDALTPVIRDIGISNGIAWVDATSSRYVDSTKPRVERIDWQEDGPVRSVFADFEPEDEPDGLAVAPWGDVFVAMWRGAKVARLDASGCQVSAIPVPARYPTSVAFDGLDGELLFVTTARHDDVSIPTTENDGLAFVARLTP